MMLTVNLPLGGFDTADVTEIQTIVGELNKCDTRQAELMNRLTTVLARRSGVGGKGTTTLAPSPKLTKVSSLDMLTVLVANPAGLTAYEARQKFERTVKSSHIAATLQTLYTRDRVERRAARSTVYDRLVYRYTITPAGRQYLAERQR